jgi:hypothetical protein
MIILMLTLICAIAYSLYTIHRRMLTMLDLIDYHSNLLEDIRIQLYDIEHELEDTTSNKNHSSVRAPSSCSTADSP